MSRNNNHQVGHGVGGVYLQQQQQQHHADDYDDENHLSFSEQSRGAFDEVTAGGEMSVEQSYVGEDDDDDQTPLESTSFNGGTSAGGATAAANTTTTAGGSSGAGVPDVMLLNILCARARAPRDPKSVEDRRDAEMSWEPVRDWLSSHDAEEVRIAAEQQGESGLTALHFACRHVPPLDVIDVLLSVAADTTVQWPDSFGWLPIHYACASGSSSDVIKALVEAYPESKTTVDRRGRTPLHFALGDKPASPDVVFLLGSTGAASYPDEIGMLPLHYACAFGASEEVLYVLTDAYPEAIRTKDRRQRTPLHFALSNAGRKTVPSAVRLLLSLNDDIVNSIDGGPLPLRVLSEYTATIKSDDEKRDEKRESVQKCLEHILNANPDPTADLLTTLQSLPDWLSERAVVMPVVQILLNEKISRCFPTGVLMMDFYMIVMIIVSYSFNVVESIDRRSNNDTNDLSLNEIPATQLIPLYAGAAYFSLRELVQIISLISLKSFKIWLYDASNYLNIVVVFLVLYWTIRMDTGTGSNDSFRVGAAISVTVLWLKLLAYLRNMLIDFAVFVGGVFYVVKRLVAFLTALCVTLIAFAQMFYTIFQQSQYCKNQPNNSYSDELILEMTRCGENELHPFCNFWTSFLKVFTMLLGEVDESNFTESSVATALFIVFMFFCVILLANVLIAIVTDSYKIIQDQRAAIVFWTNRLDFIAEMDAIANGPWKRRFKQWFRLFDAAKNPGLHDNDDLNSMSGRRHDHNGAGGVFGKEMWNRFMELFEDEIDDGYMTFEFILYSILRIVVATVIIPLWLLLGLVTLGWCWPPQIREAVFTSTVFKHSSNSVKQDELRKTQVKKLHEDVTELKDDLLQELALDRTQVVQMKSQLAERKLEIGNEIKDIKKIVAILFERQARFAQ